jgi:hypothetical protein
VLPPLSSSQTVLRCTLRKQVYHPLMGSSEEDQLVRLALEPPANRPYGLCLVAANTNAPSSEHIFRNTVTRIALTGQTTHRLLRGEMTSL